MKKIAIIPARMGSSRFPGKPLKKILDLPMIEHVRRRALLCESLDDVIVATCDHEIKGVVEGFGGKAVMTSNQHERCTDRVNEAVNNEEADIVVILQGDEPLVTPDVITQLIHPMVQNNNIYCTNLFSIINEEKDLDDCDIVKALLNVNKEVLVFSRASIPYRRAHRLFVSYRQTGLSAFTKPFLHKFSALEPTPLEEIESIDFLRILEHGFSIYGVVYDQQTVGVDQPDDIGIIEQILTTQSLQKEIYQKINQ